MSEYVVELRNITKRFPGVVALSDMKLALKPGEIHGLIGENGAGKSTLIKVLTGVYAPDEGEVLINGQKTVFKNPNDSVSAGIACVYQELNIEKLLSVTDNIFINKWIHKGLLLDYPAMHAKAKEVMASLGQDVDPRKAAGTLGMGLQQMIEIAKAVLIDAKVIIMDEPTSSLGEKEVEQLMKTCRELKSRGIAILFVSHKLEELFEMIYEKKYFFKVYLNISVWQKNVREDFPAALRNHVKELMPLMDCESEEEFYYRQLFFSEGLVAMIRRWLERDCTETPAQMSRMVERQMTQAFFRDGEKGEGYK